MLVSGAALIFVRRWARASRAASALASPHLLQILALLCERAGIPPRLAIRYRQFSFAILPSLTLHEGSRLEFFPRLQELDVFFPICLSMLLPPGSEIFFASETAKHASQLGRTHRAGFFLHRRLAHRGEFQ